MLDRERCVACGRCVDACLFDALVLYGRKVTPEEILPELLEDRLFYTQSGGGVTLSGGEPLLHPAFCAELFGLLQREGIPCAMDTCGEVPWSAFEAVLPVTELFLFDLKQMDPERHRRCTGVSNERILENLRRLSDTGKEIEIRMPLVPGFNDEEENLEAAGRFLAGLKPLRGVRLLPYHSFGRSKYHAIGHPDTMPDADRVMCAMAGAGRTLGFVCAPALFQRVLMDCVDEPSDVEAYARNREALTAGLARAGYTYVEPDGAFYLWVKALEPDAEAFFERARSFELLPVPSTSFGAAGWVRVSYCVPYDTIVNSLPAWEALAASYR